MSLTRIVQTMSSVHSTTVLVRAGRTSTSEVVASTVFSKQHFPKFLAATMTASGLAGYFGMEYLQQKQWEAQNNVYERAYDNHYQRQSSMAPRETELTLSTMLETSSQPTKWQANEHEQFLLGSQHHTGQDSPFINRIRTADSVPLPSKYNDKRGEQHQWATGE